MLLYVMAQALHWLAFLVAMNIVLLPNVQRMLTAPATGLALLMLLALGTFVAGVHVSWHICAPGIDMAFFVPAIAWLTESWALERSTHLDGARRRIARLEEVLKTIARS